MSLVLLQKIDVRSIIAGHWRTFVDESTGQRAMGDFITFYGIPAGVTALAIWQGIGLANTAVTVLTTAMSMLAGLLFNLLGLLQAMPAPDVAQHAIPGTARRLAIQTYSNIAYAILVALGTIVPLMTVANYPQTEPLALGRQIASATAIYLLVHFVLTLCMVLKRMHVMLTDRFAMKR